MLAALASPSPEDSVAAEKLSESDLGDDVVTLSYDRALRANARYRPTNKNNRPLIEEVQAGAGISQDEMVLPAAMPGESFNAAPSEVLRNDGDLRSASVTIRLSKTECARLHQHAAEAGVTVSAYMRSCTFEAESLRAEVKAAMAELRTAASKTNQAVPRKKRQAFGEWLPFGWLARLLPQKHSPSQVV
jgi:hypothetical protein